jgi:hypothetical protein
VWTGDSEGIEFPLTFDQEVSLEKTSEGGAMSHTESLIASILERDGDIKHYGIKGMRWGRRRTDAQIESSKVESEVAKKLGASDDAVAKAQALGKIRAGGISTLSNKEIQDLVTRVNLEKQYMTAFPTPVAPKTKKQKLKEFAVDVIRKEASDQIRASLKLITTKQRNEFLAKNDLAERKDGKTKDDLAKEARKKLEKETEARNKLLKDVKTTPDLNLFAPNYGAIRSQPKVRRRK